MEATQVPFVRCPKLSAGKSMPVCPHNKRKEDPCVDCGREMDPKRKARGREQAQTRKAEHAEKKRIREAERAEKKRIQEAERAEKKRIREERAEKKAEKKRIQEAERAKKKKNPKKRTLGETYHEPSRSATAVSEMYQVLEPGRNTLQNAELANFSNFEVEEGYEALTGRSSSKFLCAFDDATSLKAFRHIKTALGNDCKFKHSAKDAYHVPHAKRFKHSQYHNAKNKMQASYKDVSNKLDAKAIQEGITEQIGNEVCAASLFQGAEPAGGRFLDAHTDTHSLPTLLFSISKGDSWVEYKEEAKLAARLHIPAGRLVIVTIEIHSGLQEFNPRNIQHSSGS